MIKELFSKVEFKLLEQHLLMNEIVHLNARQAINVFKEFFIISEFFMISVIFCCGCLCYHAFFAFDAW